MHIPKALVVRKTSGSSARLRRLGAVISVAITAMTIFVLWHALQDVHYNEVTAAIGRTSRYLVGLAAGLVAVSYGSLTLYDLLALRRIGRDDVPYQIAALASFTSYPIAHGFGAVAFIAPIIRYRIYSPSGLSVFDVANISFLTGLTFWLGNLQQRRGMVARDPGGDGCARHWTSGQVDAHAAADVRTDWRTPAHGAAHRTRR